MNDDVRESRWRQLRSKVLSTEGGAENYRAGFDQARDYRETMLVLDGIRRALGISQSELARRLGKKQPTIARLLSHGENPTLGTIEEVLQSLGLHARLVIEVGGEATSGSALSVEVAEEPIQRT